jgi:hypothetical protein
VSSGKSHNELQKATLRIHKVKIKRRPFFGGCLIAARMSGV